MSPAKLVDEEKGEVNPSAGLTCIDNKSRFDSSLQSSPQTTLTFSSLEPLGMLHTCHVLVVYQLIGGPS